MTTCTDAYDALYENMKNRFTVVNDNSEYTLGEYMLMKASNKNAEAALPVARKSSIVKSDSAVALFVSYVNDKLTIKEPPVKDKTIKAFPFRSSASAFLSAVVACSVMLCFCVVGSKIIDYTAATTDEANITEYAPELDTDTNTVA